jgi:hypothetical protein
MNLVLNGTITNILKAEKGTSKAGKEWIKQTFVINTGDQYNPEVAFSVFGDEKVKNLKRHKVGDQVEVSFNLSSREYNGKYFHNLDAWKIQSLSGAMAQEQVLDDDENLDLPF